MESDNKLIQRQRMMGYFINATGQVVEAEGIEKVTIRKVAQLAAYNSATLYNYFEDLDHLLFYTLMKHLQDYTLDVSQATRQNDKPLDILYSSWWLLSSRAFSHPGIYYRLFFNKHSSRLEETVEDYYRIFPEELEKHPGIVAEMQLQADIVKRNRLILLTAFGGKPIDRELELANKIMVHTFESMLRAHCGGADPSPATAVAEMMAAVELLLRCCGAVEQFPLASPGVTVL